MLSVVCVNVGNYQGRGIEYVMRLRRAVRKHLKTDYRFYCITDEPAGLYGGLCCKPADPRLKGWWQKLTLFKPGLFKEGLVMYFDLDTYIVGDITELASYQGRFAILEDFYRKGGYGSGVMMFQSGFGEGIWNDYERLEFPDDKVFPGGDQVFLERYPAEFLQKLYPGRFVSYKVHAKNDVPEGASVVCFHGRPKPHNVEGWAGEKWHREAA